MKRSEIVTEDMMKQIESTIWLLDRHVCNMDDTGIAYTRSSLENLVYTCVLLALQERKENNESTTKSI